MFLLMYITTVRIRNQHRLVSSEEHIIHFKQDGSIIPIKMIFTEYESNDGIAYQDVTCINLYTNEFINYENICTIY